MFCKHLVELDWGQLKCQMLLFNLLRFSVSNGEYNIDIYLNPPASKKLSRNEDAFSFSSVGINLLLKI